MWFRILSIYNVIEGLETFIQLLSRHLFFISHPLVNLKRKNSLQLTLIIYKYDKFDNPFE